MTNISNSKKYYDLLQSLIINASAQYKAVELPVLLSFL